MTAVLEPEAPAPAAPGRSPGPVTAGDGRRRRRRRRRLLVWSALPVVAMLAVGAKLHFTSWATGRGIDAYETGDDDRYDDAVDWFDRAAWINVYEREIPAFDRGGALVASGQLDEARLAFEEALGLAGGGRRCKVVVNLALTMEMQGDAAAAVELDALDAQRFYVEARDVIEANGECLALTTADGNGEGDRLERATARLNGKIIAEPTMRVPRASTDQATGPQPDDPADDDLNELEERLDENAETRSEGREINESIDVPLPPRDGPSW